MIGHMHSEVFERRLELSFIIRISALYVLLLPSFVTKVVKYKVNLKTLYMHCYILMCPLVMSPYPLNLFMILLYTYV